MKRGFKIVSSKERPRYTFTPNAKQTRAAGYDFEASEDFVLPSI